MANELLQLTEDEKAKFSEYCLQQATMETTILEELGKIGMGDVPQLTQRHRALVAGFMLVGTEMLKRMVEPEELTAKDSK